MLTPKEALQALTDGKEVEYCNHNDEWHELNTERVVIKVLLDDSVKFRLKSKILTFESITIPEPYQGVIEAHQPYFSVNLASSRYYNAYRWCGSLHDVTLHQRGLIHLTKEAAIAHTKALLLIKSEL